MHVITPQIPTPIPKPAKHEHTTGGNPKAKHPPAAVPVPPKTAPIAVKHNEHAIGPDCTCTIVVKRRAIKMSAFFWQLDIY